MKTNLMMTMIIFSAAVGVAAQGGTHSFTGVVSDNMCGKQHMAKNKSAAQCTRECVKAGQDYALVVGDKVYTLNGDKSAIDKYAGEKATVIGTAKDDSITVSSISGPKK